jgi:hypothetical protein
MSLVSNRFTLIADGDHKFNRDGTKLTRFTSHEVEVRAVIEGQFLSRRLHAEKIGCQISEFWMFKINRRI